MQENNIKTPLVSIIIPVYNGSNFLGKAIDSALAQTYSNKEILVINDGSQDHGETERIALLYGDKIRYFYKENGGVSSALNFGIQNMQGEYFSWLSHDDEYAPNKVTRQVELLQRFQDQKTIALCNTKYIDKNSMPYKGEKCYPFKEGELILWEEALAYLLNCSVYSGCALMIPKHALEECGGFDERLRYTQDLYMWIQIFLKGYKLVYTNHADSLTRLHDQQLTQTGRVLYHQNCELMDESLFSSLIHVATRKNKLLFYYAKMNARNANKKIWKNAVRYGKRCKIMTFQQRFSVRCIAMYGCIRPFLRRVYYRIFRKVKTQ